MNKYIYLIQYIVIFAFFPKMLNAQVSLAPTSVFISDTKGVESFYIYNNTDMRQEVSISFQFEYPCSDDHGNVKMISNDSIKAANHDLAPYIRAFPARVIMQPNTQQTVIFQVRPIANKSDGTYWTRVVVTSNVVSQDVETVNLAGGIGTKIDYIFKQNIPVFYKKGNVNTGILVQDVAISLESSGLNAIARLLPTGNSPFIGSVSAYLKDSQGRLLAEQDMSVVVYLEALRRIELPLDTEQLPPGIYELKLVYETRRRDIIQNNLVQADPVWHTMTLRIQ